MSNNQSSVDWLIEQLTPSISLQQKHIDDLKKQAKAMHKEESINLAFKTYNYISGIMKVPFNKLSENKIHAETIYNETFNNNE